MKSKFNIENQFLIFRKVNFKEWFMAKYRMYLPIKRLADNSTFIESLKEYLFNKSSVFLKKIR